jgi:MFS family permease
MHGLYLLWWVEERHLPVAAVAGILAAGDLALTALEVPTGWLADRYGHRACLMAGSALQIAGMLCCWLGQGIPGLLAASLVVALGDAFRSGADQALLYRSCLALDRPASFQIIEARTRAAALISLIVLLLGGGAIVTRWGFAAGWMAETILSAVGLCIACAFHEPPAAVPTPTDPICGDVERSTTPGSPRSWRALMTLIVPASWLGALSGATAFFAQTAEGAAPAGTTILVAGITLAEAAGAMLATRLPAGVRIQVVLAVLGTAMLAATLVHPAIFLPVVVVLSFLLGVAEPLRAAAIQRASADDVRARAASIASACDKAAATIALLVAARIWRR